MDPDPGGPKTCGSGSGFGSATLTESTEYWMQGQGWVFAYLEHVHGVVCVGQAEQQAVEDLLPAQLTHFSVTRWTETIFTDQARDKRF